MWSISLDALNPTRFFSLPLTPGRTKLLVAVVVGLSTSLVVGLLLRQRRRRYRAVTSLRRTDTFGKEDSEELSRQSSCSHTPKDFELPTNNAPMVRAREDGSVEGSVLSEAAEPSCASAETAFPDKSACLAETSRAEAVDGGGNVVIDGGEEESKPAESNEEGRRSSVSSNDSFYSAEGEDEVMDLYTDARKLVQNDLVHCRKNRSSQLGCEDEQDFLAKLHCVRQAFDQLVQTPSHRTYFMDLTRDLMSSILQVGNQDPATFQEKFQDLTEFLSDDRGWEVTKKELTSRKVVCVNVYDVALDFVLLDAFDDVQNPPSPLVNVLHNRWLTENLKISGIGTLIWAVSKTKKGMLKSKNGFMFRFYSLSETISPTLAWGFMGTNSALRDKCHNLKDKLLDFVRSIFSREKVNYNSVDSLSEDILRLARVMAQSLQT